jgi:hypothetical protein
MDSAAFSAVIAFNGDADGIISQQLLTLSGIAPARRLTGLKRDLRLLRHIAVPADGDPGLSLYVCDINLGDNRDDLLRLMRNPTTTVTWYDHHEPGEIPASPRLKTRIVTGRGACTGLLVHADLLAQGRGQDPRWAAMAAYGDNLPEAAEALLKPLGPAPGALAALREAGTLINYNAHGETEADVLFPPLRVAEIMAGSRDPEAFIRESGLIEPLRAQLAEDEESMGALAPTSGSPGAALYVLPGTGWARRLGSTWASRAALEHPERAFAVLHPLDDGHYQVSIRAPRGRAAAPAASVLAGEFPTGGGRALAAGINRLPADRIDAFTRRFFDTYG